MSSAPLTTEQIAALSPDEASTKAARGLVAPAKWPMLGASAIAVWGECQGSGSKPYQTQVDISGPGATFRCSCPSRKFPCKHGLALLFLQAQNPQTFTAPEPTWVSEWLAARQQRAENKEAKAVAASSAPAGAAAPSEASAASSAKREAQRRQRMASGAEELARWLDDTSRKGLAALSESDTASASVMAARMVDAQAPGLGQRLTQAMALVGQGANWPARLLARLGNLQLLVDAAIQPERLPPGLQADLRQALGWPQERDEVLAQGERVTDDWLVLAQILVEREARLTERRVWLQGTQSRRRALLLDYSYAGKPFDQGWTNGAMHRASLAFYPSADPLRALLDESLATAPVKQLPQPPKPITSDSEWHALATRIAANPWAQSWPLWLGSAQLQHTENGEGSEGSSQWWLWADHRAIPLAIADHDAWQWMAMAAGAPCAVFGEWNGERLQPLTTWTQEGLWRSTRMVGETP